MAASDEPRSFHALTLEGMTPQDTGATRTLRDSASAQLINLRELQEVSAWTRLLGCTEERLRQAVAAVGPEVDEVCNHLGAVGPIQAYQAGSSARL